MITFSELPFEIPDWPIGSFDSVTECEQRIRVLAKMAGLGSDNFKQACLKIKRAFELSNKPPLNEILHKRLDVRAFTYLLAFDETFSSTIKIDKELLDEFLSVSKPFSKLALSNLILSYFKYFDELTDKEGQGLYEWSMFLQQQLSEYEGKLETSQLTRYANNKRLLFSENGPKRLTQKAEEKQSDLDTLINKLGLDGIHNSRFLTLARYQYYLKTIETIPVGSDHELLVELVKPDVFKSTYDGSLSLGHEFLKIMIDRSEGHELSNSWQRVILSIAGDPRVPPSSKKYQNWWSLLGDKRIALMRGWLRRFDLTLFLKVLEQSAKDGKNGDMDRMFKPRKAFIEGLEKAGLITESRLFLSKYAERYLKRHYDKDELPSYARVASPETSMIYLNIGNKVHMIEGSHSFTLKIMRQLPSKCLVNDYSTVEISDNALRTMVAFQYRREFKTDSGLIELRHDPYLNWQHNAIVFFRNFGVKVNFSDLIEKKEHRNYKSKFGV